MNNHRALRGALLVVGLGSCVAFAACSSDPTGTIPATAGAPAAVAGANSVAGGGSAGQLVATAGSAGSVAGGSGSVVAGASGGGAGGVGGTGGSAGSGGGAGAAVCAGAGKSLHFTDDVGGSTFATHVVADLGTDLPIADTARTVELWLFMEGKESWKSEHSILEYGGSGRCQAFGIDGGDSGNSDPPMFDPFTFSGGGNCKGDDNGPIKPAPPRTGWVHLAWSYDPTGNLSYLGKDKLNFLFTVNGVPQDIPSKVNVLDNKMPGHLESLQTKLYIGSEQPKPDPSTKDNGFTGKIDEVRIWNVARTASELSDSYKLILKGSEPGLVAYYHFDEGSGTAAKDASTKQHDAVLDTQNGRPAPTWVDSTDLVLTCKP